MGLEIITQPTIFLSPISAVNGIEGVNEAYPLLTTYQYWTSTSNVSASVWPIPGNWTMLNEPGSFIITVGGVVQNLNEYAIDRNLRTLTFVSPISAGLEVVGRQLATASPSSQVFTDIQAVSATFQTLSANFGVFTALTALSTVINVLDVKVSEVSGFDITGSITASGDIVAAGKIETLSNLVFVNGGGETLQVTDLLVTNVTADDVYIPNTITPTDIVIPDDGSITIGNNGSIVGATSATTLNLGFLSAREISIVHSPAGDNVDPMLEIGETGTLGFSGIRLRYDEVVNRLVVLSRTGSTILTSAIINTNTGQVGISGAPQAGQALTITGNVSASGFVTTQALAVSGNVIVGPGTTTQTPLRLTSGSNLTTPVAGSIEYDGNAFYCTPAAPDPGRCVVPVVLFTSGVNASPANNASAQNWFPAANDTITLAANTTYLIEAILNISNTGITSNSLGISIVGSGNVGVGSIAYAAHTTNGTAATTNATSTTYVTVGSNTAVTAAVAAATNRTIYVRGILRTTTAGTIVPQYTYSAIPGAVPVLGANNFMMLTPIGSNTVASVGTWS